MAPASISQAKRELEEDVSWPGHGFCNFRLVLLWRSVLQSNDREEDT